jgi:hypothetical protein
MTTSVMLAGEDRQYTLTRLPGFLDLFDSPPRTPSPSLATTELRALSRAERLCYNDS